DSGEKRRTSPAVEVAFPQPQVLEFGGRRPPATAFATTIDRRYRICVNAEMDVGTGKKALQINLDAKKYGTFAEIGAGQEVARRFFQVGGAAGTIAKTISAYDMTFSDAIYGPADRYVSRK